MFRVYIFWKREGTGLGWRGNKDAIVNSIYGMLKLDGATKTTIEVIFEDASWKFYGRHPQGLRYEQKFVIGYVDVPGSEPLKVCSEVTLKEGYRVTLWVLDPADQPLVEISGSRVPIYDKECGTSVCALAKSAAGHKVWIAGRSFRESFRDLFLPGSPYAYTKSDSIFSDRPLIAGMLLYEKLVEPLEDSSGP